MRYILNIGCNVNEKPAFYPSFALSKVKNRFEVVDYASFTNSYPNDKGQTVEERTLVVLVEEDENSTACEIFSLAATLDQWAIAYAPEGHLDLGALEGPRKTEWSGGVFQKEFFVTLDEAKRREADENAETAEILADPQAVEAVRKAREGEGVYHDLATLAEPETFRELKDDEIVRLGDLFDSTWSECGEEPEPASCAPVSNGILKAGLSVSENKANWLKQWPEAPVRIFRLEASK